jgi:pimeloyl-ACP methyl ester carboxylesterase
MDWIETEGGPLRFESTGAGPGAPLLLVHGGGGDRSHWARLLPLLTGRQVVTYDQRGYGESPPRKATAESLAGLARDVVSVSDALGLQRPVVVGHSFGGAVLAAALGARPDRFGGAVFLDAAGDLRGLPPDAVTAWRQDMVPEKFRASSRAWFEQALVGARPDTRVHVLATLGLTPRETYVAGMEMLLGFDPAAAVRRFTGPRLLITVRGMDGPMSLRTVLPELPNRFLDEASHWVHLDQPEEVAELLAAFLAEVDGARPGR